MTFQRLSETQQTLFSCSKGSKWSPRGHLRLNKPCSVVQRAQNDLPKAIWEPTNPVQLLKRLKITFQMPSESQQTLFSCSKGSKWHSRGNLRANKPCSVVQKAQNNLPEAIWEPTNPVQLFRRLKLTFQRPPDSQHTLFGCSKAQNYLPEAIWEPTNPVQLFKRLKMTFQRPSESQQTLFSCSKGS